MSLKYRVSDNDTLLGPFDILVVREMFMRGSISNQAKLRLDGTDDAWRLITAEYPLWGGGKDTAAVSRGDRRRISRAARPRKKRHFRSKPLSWVCFAVALFLWVAPFGFYYLAARATYQSLHRLEADHAARLAKNNAEWAEWEKKPVNDRTILLPPLRLDSSRVLAVERQHAQERIEALKGFARLFAFWISLPGSALLVWWGKRLKSISAEEAMAKDPRPPVVYFRSFDDDRRFVLSSKQRERSWGFKKYRTEEEQIVKVLKRIGPVVAIGDPEENVPLPGASRLYTTDDTWQAVAEDLLNRAALVVYRLGGTPGFVWEVKRGRKHLSPDRLVILVPPLDDIFPPPGYSRFRRQIADTISLPETLDGPVIAFQQDWAAVTFKEGSANFYKCLGDFVSSRERGPG